jgi:Aminotransferase class I and II
VRESKRALVIVDEAYLEFMSDFEHRTVAGLVRDGAQVAVFRTLSKIYGLASLAIGYTLAPECGAAIVIFHGVTEMRPVSMIALSLMAAMLPASAQDPVPYAYRPPATGDTYVPALGEIMRAVQLCHLKLSLAGKQGNWDLAKYELYQIQDSLSNAARLYLNIPVDKINMVEQPLMALSEAIKAKNNARFTRAFADLTAVCNGCHQAAHVGFITIQIPAASPFANQSFQPNGR